MLTCYYGTDWLGINALVVLTMLLIVSFVYLLSRSLPSNVKGRLTGVTKVELTQIFISIFILMILLSVTSSLCAITGAVSNSIAAEYAGGKPPTYAAGQPFPALEQPTISGAATQDPFSYAESYVGDYAFNIGPQLGIQIYSYSYAFGVLSGIWTQLGNLVADLLPENLLANKQIGPVVVGASSSPSIELGAPLGTLSSEFIDIYSPLTVLGIGIMLGQYLILVISSAVAFSLLLPIALILRSVAFSGGLIRRAANAMLAIAIGLYIIYPVMVVFDSYALNWMFTGCNGAGGSTLPTSVCNPSATYLMDTYQLTPFQGVDPCAQGASTCNLNLYAEGSPQGQITISVQSLLGQLLQQAISSYGTSATLISCGGGTLVGSILGGAYTQVACYSVDQVIYSVQGITLELAEFLFTVVVMFAINVTVTVGFALGLTKVLDSGIEGAASFWSGL